MNKKYVIIRTKMLVIVIKVFKFLDAGVNS